MIIIIIIQTLFNEDAYLTIVNLPDLNTQHKYKKNNFKKKIHEHSLHNNITK